MTGNPRDEVTLTKSSSVGVSGSASDEAREPEFVYAASREEAERLLDNSYLTKYRAVPVSKRERTFWTGLLTGYFAGLLVAILVVTVTHG